MHSGHQVGYRVVASSGERRPLFKPNWRSNQGYGKKLSRQFFKGVANTGVNYPPQLGDFTWTNELETRKLFPWRDSIPSTPLNTSSYLMRVRQSGLASPVSPATPAVLPTPALSPAPRYTEDLIEEVKEFGVDGYGSMTGLIRLRSSDESASSSTIANEHSSMCNTQPLDTNEESLQQLEQRVDRDISRFEMTFPLPLAQNYPQRSVELRLTGQESHIAYLQDENLTLKERLLVMQQEVIELRQKVQGESTGEVDELQAVCSHHGSSY